MARKESMIDPESFRGKLYLLVIDKLVIGAMIAVSFFLYDQWKTKEQRRYSEAQEEVQLAFKRAEYVKQLVPVAFNSAEEVAVRAQALVALIETTSIDDRTALLVSERLLEAGLLLSDWPCDDRGPHEHSPGVCLRWNGRHFLLDALGSRMPGALDQLLDHFEVGKWRTNDPRYEIAAFWEQLFYNVVTRHTDRELASLNDPEFLRRHLHALLVLLELQEMPMPSPEVSFDHKDDSGIRTASAWSRRHVQGLRILGNLQLLASPDAGALRQNAVNELLAFIDPPGSDVTSLGLAPVVLTLLQACGHDATRDGRDRAERCADPSLAERATRVVIATSRSVQNRNRSSQDLSDAVGEQVEAARDFVRWATAYPSARIRPLLSSIDDRTLEDAGLLELKKWSSRTEDPVPPP